MRDLLLAKIWGNEQVCKGGYELMELHGQQQLTEMQTSLHMSQRVG